MMRFSTTFAILLLMSRGLCAQDDMGDFDFGADNSIDSNAVDSTIDSSFSTDTTSDVGAPDVSADDSAATTIADPAIREIVGSDPQTADELLKAIDLLAKLDRADLAEGYLQKLLDLQLGQPALANLHRRFGSGIFVQISGVRDLNPQASEFARSVLIAARELRQDPARLASIIEQLKLEEGAKRRRLARQLIQAGATAVTPMMKAIESEPTSDISRILRTSIAEIGMPAVGPLLAFLESSVEQERIEATRLLGHMRIGRAIPYLARTYLTPALSESERQNAAAAIRQISGRAIAFQDLVSLTEEIAQQRYEGRVAIDTNVDGLAEVWIWSEALQSPQSHQHFARDVALFEAARHYKTLLMVDPLNEDDQLRNLVAGADAAKVLGGLDHELKRDSDFVKQAIESGTKTVSQALRRAMDDGHAPAMVGLAELIGIAGDSIALDGIDGQPSPLATALTHANPRVRFAAATAIAKIGPMRSFAGSSRLAEALAHFGSSTGSRAALIAHPSAEIAQSIAGLFIQAGFDAHIATSAREMLNRSTDTIDYEFFIVSDAFRKPETSQLVQLLRQNPLTARIPIGVLKRSQALSDAEQIAEFNPMVITLPETKDAAIIARVAGQLEDFGGPTAVSAERRGEMGASALEYLAILGDHGQSHGLDLSRFVNQIKRSSTTRGLAFQSIDVLGTIGSPEAQSHLLVIANQHTLPIEQRERAGQAFNASVGKFGLMLTRGQITTQYNVYNGSEALDRRSQQLLGAVLDTIEDRLTY